jgi:ABC-type uncharacterized transport system substrate-binding protein
MHNWQIRWKIPGIYNGNDEVAAGDLISYGAKKADTWRQAAVYVGRILKGKKPSDLPVVQPTKFEMVYQSQDGERTEPYDPADAARACRRGD